MFKKRKRKKVKYTIKQFKKRKKKGEEKKKGGGGGGKLCICTAQERLCLGAGEVGSCIQMRGVPIWAWYVMWYFSFRLSTKHVISVQFQLSHVCSTPQTVNHACFYHPNMH